MSCVVAAVQAQARQPAIALHRWCHPGDLAALPLKREVAELVPPGGSAVHCAIVAAPGLSR